MLKATLGEEEGKAWFDVHLDLGKIDAGGGKRFLTSCACTHARKQQAVRRLITDLSLENQDLRGLLAGVSLSPSVAVLLSCKAGPNFSKTQSCGEAGNEAGHPGVRGVCESGLGDQLRLLLQ